MGHASTRHFILGTAGHIDHGKSTLVTALTGTNPDRLPEERARGMTIELGFAHLAFDDPTDPDSRLELGIIDVPGHADFVRNMVAGVGSIDVALMVVAADDSWMPQSEEHLQILEYLGVRRGVVALTKADLAEDIDFVIEDLRTHLEGTVFANAPIVPTVAPARRGIPELQAAIAGVLRDAPPPGDFGKPRLPVDRAFSPTGVGTVVTGTLTGGSFQVGDPVVVQPSGITTRIRAIQNHKQSVDRIEPGTRTALNLADAPLASRTRRHGVQRGDTVTLGALGEPTLAVDVILTKSTREIAGQPGSLRPIRSGQKVRCHHGSADYAARVFLLDAKALGPGDDVIAELRFDTPAFMFAGDRLVLRDWGKTSTIAGGTVLDPDASPRRFRRPRQRVFLESLAAADGGAEPFIEALLGRDKPLDTRALRKTPFGVSEIGTATTRLVESGAARQRGPFLVETAWWGRLLEEAETAIRRHHEDNPDRIAISIGALRARLSHGLPPALFDLLLADLAEAGFVRTPNGIRDHSHAPALPPSLRGKRDEILAALAENPIEPPNPKEILLSDDHRKVMRFLVETGEVIELSEKCTLLAGTYRELCDRVSDRLRTGPATASDLREAIGTTRRILIPLLEKLDNEGVTLRDGDLRRLKTAG